MVQLKIERDIRNYVITRKWDYTNQKLTEEYTVARDGKLLNDQELSYFENYLRSIIPPDLFEFFLFDGEEVGNIFSTSAYNTYVRNAVFTMCGMDVFEIIRKFTRGYVAKNNSNDDDEVYDTYESAKQQIETLETEKENLDVEVGNLTKELENIDIQLTELATAFKNAGGISRKEKKQLEDEYKGDIVVSQDYGVAAMALGKGAYAIHQSGKWYTDENIDRMLMERHLNKKARRGSSKNHIKGPKKRTSEDDERFAQSFEKLVLLAQGRKVSKMGLFKKKGVVQSYDKENKKPVIKASICNGEQVAGFKDIHTGKIEEVMLIKSPADLEHFKAMHGIDEEIAKEY